jgi:hypothetical protein
MGIIFLILAEVDATEVAAGQFFYSNGIHTKVGTRSYYYTFEYKWSPYFLIWAEVDATAALYQP